MSLWIKDRDNGGTQCVVAKRGWCSYRKSKVQNLSKKKRKGRIVSQVHEVQAQVQAAQGARIRFDPRLLFRGGRDRRGSRVRMHRRPKREEQERLVEKGRIGKTIWIEGGQEEKEDGGGG